MCQDPREQKGCIQNQRRPAATLLEARPCQKMRAFQPNSHARLVEVIADLSFKGFKARNQGSLERARGYGALELFELAMPVAACDCLMASRHRLLQVDQRSRQVVDRASVLKPSGR